MKLYTEIIRGQFGDGKKVSLASDDVLTTEFTFKNKLLGRVIMRYEEPNGLTIDFFPITANTGKGGKILLHKETVNSEKSKA